MSNLKFKVGDRVVLIKDDYDVKLHSKGIVTELDDCPFIHFEKEDFNPGMLFYYDSDDLEVCINEDNLVLEETWNSPLYKALAEE